MFSLASDALPSGLTLSSAGQIAGTPTTAQTAAFTVAVTDSAGDTAKARYSIAVASSIALATVNFPPAFWGSPYNFTLSASDGVQPYSFRLSGELPPGLVFDSTSGIVTGIPQPGSGFQAFPVTVTATDSLGNAVDQATSLIVSSPLSVVLSFPAGVVGEAYSAAPAVSGGSGSFSFDLLSVPAGGPFGGLPSGLSLDPASGAITGIPTAAGTTAPFVYEVVDNITGASANATRNPDSGVVDYSIFIAGDTATAALTGPTTVRSGAPLPGSLASNLASPVWNFTSSPTGLTLSASGSSFSGTAPIVTSSTLYNVTATATSGSFSATSSFSVTVLSDLVVTGGPSGMLNGVVGNAFTASTAPTVSDVEGSASYALLQNGSPVTLSSLCPGLSFSAGVISGTPSAPCSVANLAIQVVDSFDNFNAVASTFAVLVVGNTATATLTSSATVRTGGAIAGTLSTNLSSPVWWFIQTPTSPSLGLAASGSTFFGTAPMVASSTAYSFTATATSGAVSKQSPAVSLTVLPTLTISGGPSGTQAFDVGAAITATSAPTVSNVIGGKSFVLLKSGAAYATLSTDCSGLTFSSASGQISGTPSVACSQSSLTMQVTDSFDGTSAATSSAFSIQVTAAPSVTASKTSATGFVGEAMASVTMTETGGAGTLTYAELDTTGTLAALGLSVNSSNGTIAPTTGGKPTATGTWTGKVKATDGAGVTAQTASITITVSAGLSISGTPSAGTAGTAYAFTPAVAGGSGGDVFSVTNVSGTLAALGLSFNTATGAITGSAPVAGAWSGTITVTDAGGGAAMLSFSITVGGSSSAFGWGLNSDGNGLIGDGTRTQRLTPVNIGGNTFTQVSAGSTHSCGLVNDGTIQCWGSNGSGELGNGTTTPSNSPVTVPGITGATAVSAGDGTTCAVASGAAKCWGRNDSGQVGDGTTTNRLTPVQVSGLTSGVTVISVSNTLFGADGTTCAVVAGAAKCWGANNFGTVGDGTMTNRLTPVQVSGLTFGVTGIAGNVSNTCAVVSGAAMCWGASNGGGIGDGTTTNRLTPVQVSGLTSGVTAISTGGGDAFSGGIFASSCAVVSGAAMCWGRNNSGQVGDGTTTNRLTPVQVSGLTSGVTAISTNSDTSCAIVAGAAKCWGNNGSGQVGDGTTTQRLTPTQVSGLTSGVTAVSVGGVGFVLAK